MVFYFSLKKKKSQAYSAEKFFLEKIGECFGDIKLSVGPLWTQDSVPFPFNSPLQHLPVFVEREAGGEKTQEFEAKKSLGGACGCSPKPGPH